MDYPFLNGGGEMGERVRSYDWSSTSIGIPEFWPSSLQTTVSIILNSRFPMFLWWGAELIQFYNDAYRPSLGKSGKHPRALAQNGQECWPEIWDTIKPLIDQVFAGHGATWSEDQLIPIYRNNKLEDVYWTFSYTPVVDETGTVGGVLVICSETTEKVKNLRRLEEREFKLKNMILQAPLAMALFRGSNLLIETANPKMMELWGRNADEVTGKSVFEVLPDANDQGFEEMLLRVYRTKEPLTANEFPISLLRNGIRQTLFINFVYEPVFEEDHSISGVITIATDVSALVEARRRVEESERRFRGLIEEAPVATCLFSGPQMIIEIANEAMIKIWGKGGAVIGKPVKDALPELQGQLFLTQLDTVFNTGNIYKQEAGIAILVVGGVRRTYFFDYSFKPLFNKDGEVYGIMEMAVDVTDKVLAQKKIEDSEKQFRDVLMQSPSIFCILEGPDKIITFANPPLLNSWGRTEDIVGKPLLEMVPEIGEQNFPHRLDEVYKTGNMYYGKEEKAVINKNGRAEDVYYNYVYQPIMKMGNVPSGITIMANDITEQVLARKSLEETKAQLEKRVEERTSELQTANYNLEKTNKELEQFAYAASHDMQEPLRKVKTFRAMLMHHNESNLDARGKSYITRIETSVDRMIKIIDGLLQFSNQIVSEEEFVPTDLNNIIDEIEGDLDLLIQEKEALIIKDDLPIIKAAPIQMNQLFTNLFSNSLKYSKPGVPVKIMIKSKTLTSQEAACVKGLLFGKQYFKITFIDNGIGFEPEYADKIFSLFSRLHGKDEYEGTGIGLGLCKKIVLNYNGAIWAESVPGMGSTFHIVLPQ